MKTAPLPRARSLSTTLLSPPSLPPIHSKLILGGLRCMNSCSCGVFLFRRWVATDAAFFEKGAARAAFYDSVWGWSRAQRRKDTLPSSSPSSSVAPDSCPSSPPSRSRSALVRTQNSSIYYHNRRALELMNSWVSMQPSFSLCCSKHAGER